MTDQDLLGVVEAVLFVSGEALDVDDFAAALDLTPVQLQATLDRLASLYDYERRGLTLLRFGNKVQLATRGEYVDQVERVLSPVRKQTLSQAAMETLSYIAYRQPVTRADIERVRGVKCDYTVSSLVGKGLIHEVGRRDTLGRPVLYGTTEAFLKYFGIQSLSELPERDLFSVKMEPSPGHDAKADQSIDKDAQENPSGYGEQAKQPDTDSA